MCQVEEEVSSRPRLELSMCLFCLQEFEVFHNPLLDTKVHSLTTPALLKDLCDSKNVGKS